jgi:hypothetical protein
MPRRWLRGRRTKPAVQNCPFMLTRALKKTQPDRQRVLPRPKPDISVAFRLPSIIKNGYMKALPKARKRIMIYETQERFFFFFLEIELPQL